MEWFYYRHVLKLETTLKRNNRNESTETDWRAYRRNKIIGKEQAAEKNRKVGGLPTANKKKNETEPEQDSGVLNGWDNKLNPATYTNYWRMFLYLQVVCKLFQIR